MKNKRTFKNTIFFVCLLIGGIVELIFHIYYVIQAFDIIENKLIAYITTIPFLGDIIMCFVFAGIGDWTPTIVFVGGGTLIGILGAISEE